MKFSEFKALPRNQPHRSLLTQIGEGMRAFLPTGWADRQAYNNETVCLCMGTCPQCGHPVTTEVDTQRKKTFYQCAGQFLHFYVRDQES